MIAFFCHIAHYPCSIPPYSYLISFMYISDKITMVPSGLCGKIIGSFCGSATKLFATKIICTSSKAVFTKSFAQHVIPGANSNPLHLNDNIYFFQLFVYLEILVVHYL